MYVLRKTFDTVGGRNPAPVDKYFTPLFIRFYTSQVVQDFFHQQYLSCFVLFDQTKCMQQKQL